MSVDKEKLKALAGLATQGDWERDGCQVCPVADQNASLGRFGKSADAAYVAALQPSIILALLEEIDLLKADLGSTAHDQDQLKAENEALRKDAERYRFVRELAWYVDQAAFIYELGNSRSPWASERMPVDADEVEEAIDAAMAKEAK